MKPFETRYTEWVDGLLTGQELADFEAELAMKISLDKAAHDRAAAQQLGSLLRERATGNGEPILKNPDFFNLQLLQQIEAEQPRPATKNQRARERMPGFWSIGRFVWGGAASLGIAALIFVALVMPGLHTKGPPMEYYAQIINTKPGDSQISAVAFHDNKENVTVLWLDGLAYMPKEHRK